jgi:predicted TIM-barrel fold metal-dependent hydrolase
MLRAAGNHGPRRTLQMKVTDKYRDYRAALASFVEGRRDFFRLFGGAALMLAPAARALSASQRRADDAEGTPTRGRIDVHHHIIPGFYVTSMKERGVMNVGGVPFPQWSPARMIGSMDSLGVDQAVVSVSAPGVSIGDAGFERESSRALNEYCAELARDYAPRIGAFATVPDPASLDAVEETRHALEALRLDGVCLFSSYGGRYLGDPAFDDYLAFLDARSAIVFVHPTLPIPRLHPDLPFDPPIIEFVFETTRTVASMLYMGVFERYPRIRFIVAHLGGTLPFLAWRLRLFETSTRDSMRRYRENNPHPVQHYLSKLYYDVAVSASPGNLAATRTLAGPERLLFGSDFPFVPPDMLELNMRSLEHTGPDRDAIAYANAAALFPRFAAPYISDSVLTDKKPYA